MIRDFIFELLEDFEFLCGKRFLSRSLVRLRQTVVGLRKAGLQSYCVAQLLNRFLVPLLIRK